MTKRKVLESSAERPLLRVRYSYFDPSRDGARDWPQVLLAERACTGFAERDFTLERGPLGYQVVEHERRGAAPDRRGCTKALQGHCGSRAISDHGRDLTL